MSDAEDLGRYRAECSREWMRHVAGLKRRVKATQDAIEQARSMMLPQGIAYDGGGGSGCYADAIPDGVAKLEGMIAEYSLGLAAMVDEERRARTAIASLEHERHRTAVERHYLLGETFGQVAEATGYSTDSVKRNCREGLIELYDRIPEEYRRMPAAV